MPRRYSDILRGPLLNLAYQKRQTYLARPMEERGQNIGRGTPRSPLVYVAVVPFGMDLPTGTTGYRSRSNQRNRTRLSGAVGTRAVSPPPASATFNGGFTPAKIRLFVKTGVAVAKTSAVTGIRYLRQPGENYLHPFGQTGTEKEFDAFETIAAALISDTNRVTYSAERFSLQE